MDFSEINNLIEIFKKSNKKINYRIEVATKENFFRILYYRPKVLHFICHGDYDKKESIAFLGFEKINGELERCYSRNLCKLNLFFGL